MTLLFGAGVFIAPVLTIVFAELSFRLLERPVLRRGGAQRQTRDPAATPSTIGTMTAESAPLSIESP